MFSLVLCALKSSKSNCNCCRIILAKCITITVKTGTGRRQIISEGKGKTG
jgi:hypothetical protein